MEFLTGTTTAYDLTEGQCRSLLDQAIDLNTLVWIFGICLAVHAHRDCHLFVLRTKRNGHGLVEPKLCEVEESELLFCLKSYATEKLPAQRVFAALAQDFEKADARQMFSWVFMQSTPYPFGTANSDRDSSDEASPLVASKEARGTGALPSIDQDLEVVLASIGALQVQMETTNF